MQAAAEIADDAGRNGQPEAEPVTGRLGREEGLEQVGLRLGAEPGAMVADMQADAAVGAFPGEVDAWPGLAGWMSMKVKVSSSSWTLMAGILPRTILQKMQLAGSDMMRASRIVKISDFSMFSVWARRSADNPRSATSTGFAERGRSGRW